MDWSDLPRLGILIAMGLVILKRIWQSQVKLATSEALAQIQGINPLHQHLFLWGFGGILCCGTSGGWQSINQRTSHITCLDCPFVCTIANDDGIFIHHICPNGCYRRGLGSVWLDIQTGLSIVLMLAIGFYYLCLQKS